MVYIYQNPYKTAHISTLALISLRSHETPKNNTPQEKDKRCH